MGNLRWAAYTPEQINWAARSRVEAYTRREVGLEEQPVMPRAGIVPGLLFTLAMVVLAVATYLVL